MARTFREQEPDETSGDVQEFCRGINARIVDHAAPGDTVNLVCECPHPGCFVNIRMPAAEFRQLLGGSLAYVVAPGHVEETAVVRRERGYDVVMPPELPGTPFEHLLDRVRTREAPLQHPPVG